MNILVNIENSDSVKKLYNRVIVDKQQEKNIDSVKIKRLYLKTHLKLLFTN